jgi:hypothetical protein
MSDKKMREWDATWQSGHVPRWVYRSLRTNEWGRVSGRIGLHHGVLDHFGTITRDGVKVLVGQPYNYGYSIDEMNADANVIANKLGCDLEWFAPAPWSDGTVCYLFIPKTEGT